MVTPEVESQLDARLTEFETNINTRLTEFETRLSARLTEFEANIGARLTEFETRLDSGFAELLAGNQEINRRLDWVFYIWLGMGGVLLVNMAVTLSLRFL